MKPKLVPTAVAAVALGVKPDAVRQMFRRGRLTRYGSPEKALVDLAECEARLYGGQSERAAA